MEKIVMSKVVKQMFKKINWLLWLLLVILWNYGFPNASPFHDVLVAVFLSILFIIIQLLLLRYLQKSSAGSKFRK
jgi:hypothetical protein